MTESTAANIAHDLSSMTLDLFDNKIKITEGFSKKVQRLLKASTSKVFVNASLIYDESFYFIFWKTNAKFEPT